MGNHPVYRHVDKAVFEEQKTLKPFSRNLCPTGFRIDVSVRSWIQLPMFSESLHRLSSFFSTCALLPLTNRGPSLKPWLYPPQFPLVALTTPRINQVYPRQTFVETDIDKSLHTNETNPKEGGIQQAEIFGLQVLTSQPQHHGDGHDSARRMTLTKSCHSANTCLCNYTHSGLRQNNRLPMRFSLRSQS